MPTTPSRSRQTTYSSAKKNTPTAHSASRNQTQGSKGIFDDVERTDTSRRAGAATGRRGVRSAASTPASTPHNVKKSGLRNASLRHAAKDTASSEESLDESEGKMRRSHRDRKPTEKVLLSSQKVRRGNGVASTNTAAVGRETARKDYKSDGEVDEAPMRSKRERKPSAKAVLIEREHNGIQSPQMAKSSVQKPKRKLPLEEEMNSPSDELGSPSLQVPRRRGRPPKNAAEQGNNKNMVASPLKTNGRTPSKRVREELESPRSAKRRKETHSLAVTPSKLNKTRPEELADNSEPEELAVDTPSKRKRGRPPKKLLSDSEKISEPLPESRMDIDEVEKLEPQFAAVNIEKRLASPEEAKATVCLSKIVLKKLSGRHRIPLVHLEEEYAKVHNLVVSTVTAGEGNSMVIIGARGAGKTELIETVLANLAKTQKDYFHIIRLNGFIQTDDKLALREIWRQLGREMEIDEEAGKSYADTLTMLLALLSHPDEIAGEHLGQVAKSVVFIMDEFDLFATHSRQTLLYNLLDIAQSRKAPIAVLGVTTKFDVKESLEKRVKSRFSHRYVHVSLAKSMLAFQDICMAAISIQPEELSFEEKALVQRETTQNDKRKKATAISNPLSNWNDAVKVSAYTSKFKQVTNLNEDIIQRSQIYIALHTTYVSSHQIGSLRSLISLTTLQHHLHTNRHLHPISPLPPKPLLGIPNANPTIPPIYFTSSPPRPLRPLSRPPHLRCTPRRHP
jgi:AAA ATPase-like protein